MIENLIDKHRVGENPNADDDAGVDFVDSPVPHSCIWGGNLNAISISIFSIFADIFTSPKCRSVARSGHIT